jgi:outer membrane protein assembly factor BamB
MKSLLISLLYLSIPLTVNAQNWPSFRGPNASGVAEGTKPPTNWDVEKSQNVLWTTPIPGLSHASPIVWGNRIFVITAVSSDAKTGFIAKDRGIGLATDEAKHTWMIYAIDQQNGKVVWSRTAYEGVPRAKRHVKATQANSTPVTDGRYVVALFGSEGLAAYNFKDGKLVWKQDLGVLNPGLWDDKESSWGHSSSPIIFRDLVIVQADGHKQSFIAAYNLKDGKQAWRVERNEITSWTTPSIYEGRSRTELIVNGGRYVRGYDPLTGKELWRFADNDTQVKMQAPLVANDLIYITGGYPPGRAMYAFRPGAVGDISLKSGLRR